MAEKKIGTVIVFDREQQFSKAVTNGRKEDRQCTSESTSRAREDGSVSTWKCLCEIGKGGSRLEKNYGMPDNGTAERKRIDFRLKKLKNSF